MNYLSKTLMDKKRGMDGREIDIDSQQPVLKKEINQIQYITYFTLFYLAAFRSPIHVHN